MAYFQGEDGTRFHFNDDFSGVVMILPPSPVIPAPPQTERAMAVPGRDLLGLVAYWVFLQKRRVLEGASEAELLGLPETMLPRKEGATHG